MLYMNSSFCIINISSACIQENGNSTSAASVKTDIIQNHTPSKASNVSKSKPSTTGHVEEPDKNEGKVKEKNMNKMKVISCDV